MMSKRAFRVTICFIGIVFLILFGLNSIFSFKIETLKFSHPNYKMESTYDNEAKTIFWKGKNFKKSPLGTIKLKCDCGRHSN